MKKWEKPTLSNLNLDSTSTICPLATTYTWRCSSNTHCEKDSMVQVKPGDPCPVSGCDGYVKIVCSEFSPS